MIQVTHASTDVYKNNFNASSINRGEWLDAIIQIHMAPKRKDIASNKKPS